MRLLLLPIIFLLLSDKKVNISKTIEHDYYPYTKGNRWEYSKFTLYATGNTREVNGKIYYELIWNDDYQQKIYRCKVDGIYYTLNPDALLSPSQNEIDCIFYKDNAELGESWFKEAFGYRYITVVVAKDIEMSVAGREYTNVIQLNTKILGFGSSRGNDIYIADGIGIIKVENESGVLMELINFQKANE